MDIWAAPGLRLLQIKLLGIFMFMTLRPKISFILDKYQEQKSWVIWSPTPTTHTEAEDKKNS